MDASNFFEGVSRLLEPWTLKTVAPEGNRLDVYIEPASLLPAINALIKARWGYFSAITGLDQPPSGEGEQIVEGQIELLYHFCQGPAVLTLRTSVPYSQPVLDSICDLLPSATLYERELIEMFGVVLEGTTSTERLLLSDDWPDGVYPLRKSFTGFDEHHQEAQDGSPA
jgi:NADH:ubiquinone oxidoreductase subunit C